MENHIAFAFDSNFPNRFHALEVRSPMTWCYACTFLVTWRDAQTNDECILGGFPANDCHRKVSWFVAFGVGRMHELMLYIHLPLKLGDSPRGQWHTYLVIPAECLDTSNINATSRLDVVSSAGPQFEKAGVKPGTELVRCHFQLKELGCAFMALPETQKQISAHFRGLLLSLKSLANADTFQIYLPKTAETWDTLHAFFQTLNSGMCTSPEIDKRASFNSRGVSENDWKAHCIDDEEPPAVGWNPIIQEGPPPYEQAIHEPGRNAANVVDVLGVSSPHPDSSSLPRPSSAQSIPDTETAFASDNSIHDGQNEDKADGAERHAADHGGSNDRQERGGDSPAEGHPQPPRPPKRKAGRAFSDAESPGRRCAHGHRSDKAGCRRPTAREAEEERRAAHSVGIPFAVHQSCAEFEATAVTLLLKDVLIAPGSISIKRGAIASSLTRANSGGSVMPLCGSGLRGLCVTTFTGRMPRS